MGVTFHATYSKDDTPLAIVVTGQVALEKLFKTKPLSLRHPHAIPSMMALKLALGRIALKARSSTGLK